MGKQKKPSPRKSTIGSNPLDQIEMIRGRNGKKAKFKDETPQAEIKQVLLKKRPAQEGSVSRWFKSVLKHFS
jgi:hypothetical protein